ncbi:MAG: aldo/keto reductase [Lachnospiraceae bacterium]|nr:aldo/keto reductase [Lachnospiraceae bacterium]
MNYRRLGKTGLMVSEVGFGGEWISPSDPSHAERLLSFAEAKGINILDCWMSDPGIRKNIGSALKGHRENWIIQGHIGSTWQDGQYVRTREIDKVKKAFQDLLELLQTDYIDLGMIHYVDAEADWETCMNTEYIDYVRSLKEQGIIRHIGLSTHNPVIAKKAVETGFIEMILFSVNPAFDLLPPNEDLNVAFAEEYDASLGGINKERAELYALCEANDVGITVMKGFAGGRLFDPARSPFGVKLTPVQCLHYCLTRPAVASVLAGFDTEAQIEEAVSYETASDEEKDYASVLASAPKHAYTAECTYCGHCKPCPVNIDIAMVNKLYDLATIREEVPDSVRSHYAVLEVKAGDCLGCRSCEERCPFGIKIADRMVKTAELFGE